MKRKAVKGLAFLTAAAMTATALPGTGIPVQAADETWISDENLSEEDVAEPAKDTVLPDANQYRYQKEELAAFCHFGPNTFNNTEWGDYGSKKAADVFTLSKDFDAVKLVETLKEAGFEKLIVTAKHHDGFCIWDSKYTEFDVAATNYKTVREISWRKYPKHAQMLIWIWGCICRRGTSTRRVMDIMMRKAIRY